MKKRLSTIAALAVGATCLFTPATAHADTANQCWTSVETGESHCFTTFAAVVADLSDGQVQVSGGASTFSASEASAVTAAAATSVTAAIVWEDASYGGASNTYIVSSACDNSDDVDYQVNLTGTAWDNRISSFKAYNACQTKLWTGVYTGSGYGWYDSSSYVGATMNDAASSIQWR